MLCTFANDSAGTFRVAVHCRRAKTSRGREKGSEKELERGDGKISSWSIPFGTTQTAQKVSTLRSNCQQDSANTGSRQRALEQKINVEANDWEAKLKKSEGPLKKIQERYKDVVSHRNCLAMPFN